MKQSQFASFRASRYPTFSSFARLNLVLPACETEWGKKTLKKESNLLNPTRSWAFVLIAQCATTCVGHSLYSTKSSPITSDVSSEQSVSSVSTCHKQTQPGPGVLTVIWAPAAHTLHDATALPLLLLCWSSHQAT